MEFGTPRAKEEIAEELHDLLEQVYFGGKKGRRQLTKASESS